MTDLLPHLRIHHGPKKDTPDASIIWLHGLGADGHDFEPIVPELRLPADKRVDFIFPHAPIRPVTVNMGMTMRSWYDILAMTEVRKINPEQLRESCQQLKDFIDAEIASGVDSSTIIIAGFSQGGAVALNTAPCYPQPLGGILALSTYQPTPEWVTTHRAEENTATPIFMAHGTQDPVVPIALAELAKGELESQGYAVDWRSYSMPHAVCPQQINDISGWLLKVLGYAADS